MWIPVSDGLPNDGTRVLVVVQHGRGLLKRNILIAHINIPNEDDTWEQSWHDDEVRIDKHGAVVTHWMPLPGLPMEKLPKSETP